MNLKHIVLISFLSIILAQILLSCAQIVAPTGGKKDTLAPVVIKMIPKNQTINFSGKQIELTFDEYVSVDNIQQQLVITPNLEGSFQTKVMPKGARITLDNPLKENTTYNFNFRNAFKDVSERNPAKNVRLVISTGKIIDSLKVNGKVMNPITNKPVQEVSVGLYLYSDTLTPKKNKPYYFIKTDSAGNFAIENIAAAKYRIYAVADANNNLLYEEAKEMIGFIKDTITLTKNLENLNIKMARMDKTPTKVIKTRNTANYYYIEYNRGQKEITIDFLKPTEKTTYQQLDARTIRVFNVNNATDTIKVKVTVVDSLNRTFTHDQKIKFKIKSKKDESVKDEFKVTVKPTNNEDIDLQMVGYKFTFTKPIASYKVANIEILNDTIVSVPVTEKDLVWNKDKTEVIIKMETKKPKEFVRVTMPKGTFISIENDSTEKYKAFHPIRDPENYGIISGEIKNPTKKAFIVELLNDHNEVVAQVDNKAKYEFAFLKPSIYAIRLIVDENRNGKWDSGDVIKNQLPEPLLFIAEKIKLKQNFELVDYNYTIE